MTKLWIDPEGTLHPIPEGQSHEEWVNEHGHELEDLLAKEGWVRIQNVPPPYLLIDCLVPLNAGQAKAVAVLCENRYERVVVQFQGEVREFGDGEEAMAWVMESVC